MKLSFITPREKSIFAPDTRLWMTFVMALFLSLILASIGSSYLIDNSLSNQITFQQKINDLKTDITRTQSQIDSVKKQKELSDTIYAKNSILKESLSNIIGLIPDEMLLLELQMYENELRIVGITPTKEMYNFLLAPPLVSIFDTSKVYFTSTKGGQKFVSINTLNHEREE